MEHIDEALIDILPDFTGFDSRLRARLAEERTVDIKARLEATEVEREINRLAGNTRRIITLQAKLEDIEAKTKLAELGTNRKVELQLNLQAAKAKLDLAILSGKRTAEMDVELKGVKDAEAALVNLAREARNVKIGDLQFKVDQTGLTANQQAAKLGGSKQKVITVEAKLEDAKARVKLHELTQDTALHIQAELDVKKFRLELLEAKRLAGAEEEEVSRRGRSLGDILSSLGGRGTKVTGALVALGLANLTPLVSSVVALSSALAVAGTAAGVFSVATVGHIAQVTTVMKAMKDEGLQLNTLPVAFQNLIPAVKELQNTWGLFLDKTRGPVFDVFIKSMDIAKGLLQQFVPIVNSVATGLSTALGGIKGFTISKEFTDFLAVVKTQGPAAINSLITSVTNLSAGLLSIFTGFAPAGQSMLKFIEDLTLKFRTWATGLQGSPGFTKFLDYTKAEGPKILGILADFTVTVGKLVVALAPVGALVSTVLSGFLRLTSALSPTAWKTLAVAIGAVFLELRGAAILSTVVAAFRGLTIVTALTSAFTALRSAIAIGGAAGVARLGILSLGAVLLTTVARATAAVAVLYGLGHAVNALDGTATKAVPGINAMTQSLLHLTDINKLLQEHFDTTSVSLAGLLRLTQDPNFADYLNKFGEFFAGYDTAGDAEKYFASIDTALTQLVTSGHVEEAKKAFADMSKGLDPGDIERLKQALPGFSDAMIGVAAGTNTATDALTGQASVLTTLKERYDIAKAAALGLGTAEGQVADDILKGWEGLEAANRTVASATLAESKARTDASKANTAADRTLASARRSLASADRAVASAGEAVTKAYADQKKAITAAAEATIALEDAKIEAARRQRDSVDNEESASIALARAKENLIKVNSDPLATDLDRRQAILDLKNAQEDYNDSAADGAKIRLGGVEGDAGVIQSRKDLTDANDAVAQSEKDITTALQAQKDAKQAQADAQIAVNDAIANQKTVLQNGKDTVAAAIQATKDAKIAQNKANREYNASITALEGIQGASDIAGDKLGGLRGQLAKQLRLDTGNVTAQLHDVARNMEALRILAATPALSWQEAWRQAEANVTAAEKWAKGKPSPTGGARPYDPSMLGPAPPNPWSQNFPANALGGPVFGIGTSTSDSIMAFLSNNEHIWSAAEVEGAGGHAAVARMRKAALAHTAPVYNSGPVRVSKGQTEKASVTVNQVINNPLQERATVSGPKGLRRAANQLGR